MSLEAALSLLEAKAGPGGKRAKLPSAQVFYSKTRQQADKALLGPQLAEEWKSLEEGERRQWAIRALDDWRKDRPQSPTGLAPLLGLEQSDSPPAVDILVGEAAAASANRKSSNGSRPGRVSGYILFSKQRRLELAAAGSRLSQKAIMSELGAEWRALPEKEKGAWRAKAEQQFAAQNGASAAANGSSVGQPQKATGAVKAAKAKPAGQKRGVMGFIFFSQHVRAEVKQQGSGLKPTEITKLAGERWRQFSQQEKQEWNERAAAESGKQLAGLKRGS